MGCLMHAVGGRSLVHPLPQLVVCMYFKARVIAYNVIVDPSKTIILAYNGRFKVTMHGCPESINRVVRQYNNDNLFIVFSSAMNPFNITVSRKYSNQPNW